MFSKYRRNMYLIYEYIKPDRIELKQQQRQQMIPIGTEQDSWTRSQSESCGLVVRPAVCSAEEGPAVYIWASPFLASAAEPCQERQGSSSGL